MVVTSSLFLKDLYDGLPRPASIDPSEKVYVIMMVGGKN
jgi:hypothetical protein